MLYQHIACCKRRKVGRIEGPRQGKEGKLPGKVLFVVLPPTTPILPSNHKKPAKPTNYVTMYYFVDFCCDVLLDIAANEQLKGPNLREYQQTCTSNSEANSGAAT